MKNKKFNSSFPKFFGVFLFLGAVLFFSVNFVLGNMNNNSSVNSSSSGEPVKEESQSSDGKSVSQLSPMSAEETKKETGNEEKKKEEKEGQKIILSEDSSVGNTGGNDNPKVVDVKEDKVSLAVDDKDAKKVEYYVEGEGASPDIYLGSAKEENGLNLDVTQRMTNGIHNVYGKVKTDEGEYKTKSVPMRVNIPNDNGEERKASAPVAVQPATDSDSDGISDAEEKRLGTNPYLADSDRDGYLDGDEVKGGFDPLKFSPGDKRDKIIFQSPKEKGIVKENYKIEKVELKKKTGEENLLHFTGKALSNSFVTLYIYSNDPIIVTVKTNENGDWYYDLDKNLPDGDHEAYVAVTDNTGRITAKSEPFRFVKTAQAVEVATAAELGKINQQQSPVERSKANFILYSLILSVAFLSIAIAVIGAIVKSKRR